MPNASCWHFLRPSAGRWNNILDGGNLVHRCRPILLLNPGEGKSRVRSLAKGGVTRLYHHDPKINTPLSVSLPVRRLTGREGSISRFAPFGPVFGCVAGAEHPGRHNDPP